MLEPIRYSVKRGINFPIITVQPAAVLPPEEQQEGTILRDHWLYTTPDGADEGTPFYRVTRYETWFSIDRFPPQHLRRFLLLTGLGHTIITYWDGVRNSFVINTPGIPNHPDVDLRYVAGWKHLEDDEDYLGRMERLKRGEKS
jgi:hypothetical protein